MDTATDRNEDLEIDHWHEAVDLAGLHVCRSIEDLDRELVCKLVRLFPGTDIALLLAAEDPGRFRVQVVLGSGCPWPTGDTVDAAAWANDRIRSYSITYRNHTLGRLLIDRAPDEILDRVLTAMLAHYGVALVNLTLNEESRQATEHYCASLQALEEGIVLFQEGDHEAVTARLMGLATAMLQATAGALYVLREVGNVESDLVLTQTLGIPDALLATFKGQGGTAWPQCLLARSAFYVARVEDPTLGGLDPADLPDILRDIVALPLRYHGVDAGVIVLFNVAPETGNMHDHLDRMNSLGQLGAALLHRLSLEAISARNRSIEKELQIAEAIQKRLLPSKAPATTDYEFAWRSVAAQNIGGDYLDVLTSDLGDVHAVIADASGHGINSALLMSSFRSTYRAEAPWEEPADLTASLNNEVQNEVGSTGMFITAAMLRIEQGSRRLTMSNAGHNPVLHWRAATGKIEPIESHGPPLGFMEDAEYGTEERTLAPGDVLFLYTDGISEACDRELDMFGDERLAGILAANAHRSAAEILEAALAELARFTGRLRYDDDVSLSVIKVR
ncbi:MAG: serine/threonine-protein phosphatase [Planctomycetes bacterium]|nr:serine/threonine-protein phosphatase [Planctomycetota bacterium]